MTYLKRKKLAFMSIVNKVKGFIRTVSGVSPLTLPDCVDEESLINYSIEGNSVQNGTPTPDAPIEVVSVGDKTKNLFELKTPDLKGQPAYNGYGGTGYTVYDYGYRISAYTGIGFWFNDLEVGETYTLSCKFLTSGTSGVIFVIGQNQGQAATSSTKKQAWNNALKEGQFVSLQFTADETNLLSFGLGNSTAIEIGEIQLEKSSARTDYEPYGYKIPIVCSGKNLFNVYGNFIKQPNCLAQTTSGTEITITYETQVWGDYIPITLLPGTYTISYDVINKTETAKISFKAWNNFTTAVYTRANAPETVGTRCNISFTLTEQAKYIQFYTQITSGVGSSYTIGNIQIEKASVATDYEPYTEPVTTNIYLDEPLRKIGDYADYIDFGTQKVVRNTRILNASSNMTKYVHNSTWCSWYFTGFQKKNMDKSLSNVCEYIHMDADFTSSTHALSMGRAANTTNGTYALLVRIKNDALGVVQSDTDAVKLSSAKHYLESCGAYFITLITTPIEKNISIPQLPTAKGTTIYTIDTTTQPTNMSATYYSTSKE